MLQGLLSAESALIKRTIFFFACVCLSPYFIARVVLPTPAKALTVTNRFSFKVSSICCNISLWTIRL